MLFTFLYLIGFMIVLLGLAFEMPSLSFVCTRLWVGFGGLLGELPLLLLVLSGVWIWELSLSLNWGAYNMGVPIFTLVALGATFNFSSGITLPQHQPISLVFGTIWGQYHLGPGSALTWCGYHHGWLPLAGVGGFL